MSDNEQLPTFESSADPREEAMWQAYQAMLRRRKAPRTGTSYTDFPLNDSPRPSGVGKIRPQERIAGSRPQAPVASPAVVQRRSEWGGGELRPAPERSDRTPRPPRAERPGAGPRIALGAAVMFVAGAALAIVLWPRIASPGNPGAAEGPAKVRPAQTGTAVASEPALPCFIGSRLIGRMTVDACANRGGVASGPLNAAGATAAADVAPPVRRLPPVVESPATTQANLPPPARSLAVAASSPQAPPSAPGYRAPSPAPPPVTERPAPVEANAEGYRASVEPLSPRRASVTAVRAFYSALGQADGARAAATVVPEKRENGPLSARELTRFYSSLRAPLHVTQVAPIDDNTVFVRYQFVSATNRLCSGTATVSTTQRDGDTLVRGIRGVDECGAD